MYVSENSMSRYCSKLFANRTGPKILDHTTHAPSPDVAGILPAGTHMHEHDATHARTAHAADTHAGRRTESHRNTHHREQAMADLFLTISPKYDMADSTFTASQQRARLGSPKLTAKKNSCLKFGRLHCWLGSQTKRHTAMP